MEKPEMSQRSPVPQSREAPAGPYILTDKATLEEALFHFLRTMREGRAQAVRPLVATPATLRELYTAPHPDLWKAWRHCLDAFLVQLSPDPARLGTLQVPSSVLALTLAVHNCLAPVPVSPAGHTAPPGDLVGEFTAALVATVPPASSRDAALAYHAVLRGLAEVIPLLAPTRAALAQALLERSPLTALWALDVHTPATLEELATELLPGWRRRVLEGRQVWPTLEAWLEVITALLAEPLLARWLRHRWLALPESLSVCRNIGLVLEALRRQGKQRAFILEFYEAYDYRCMTRSTEAGQGHGWPLLHTMATLLRSTGDGDDGEAALRLNRRGNAYFLKFYPLMRLVIEERGIPTDYAHLRREFVLTLRALLPYVTIGARQRVVFSEVTFGEQHERESH